MLPCCCCCWYVCMYECECVFPFFWFCWCKIIFCDIMGVFNPLVFNFLASLWIDIDSICLYHGISSFLSLWWLCVCLGVVVWAIICGLIRVWKTSAQALPVFTVSIEILDVTLLGFPLYVTLSFSLAVFNIPSLLCMFSILIIRW